MGEERTATVLFFVRCAIVLLGVGGITAQSVLLRELLVQYHGNEFSVGIIIGNWVAAAALGAFLAGMVRRGGDPARQFVILTAVFTLSFPICIALCRMFKPFVAIQPGMGLTISQLYFSSLLLVLFPAGLQGGLFIVATRLHAAVTGDGESASGMTYAIDSAGTMLGGLICTFLFVPLLSPMQVGGLLILLGGAVSLLLPGVLNRGAGTAPLVACAMMLLTPLLLFSGAGGWIEKETISRQWQGGEIVSSRNSPYQNITIVRNEGELTVYTDGMPLTTLPNPDIVALEELAHIPALIHPEPRSILLAGGGSGGLPAELLKHPSVRRIDSLEPDPLLAELLSPLQQGADGSVADDRLRTHLRDGRRFLQNGGETYDLVLINIPLPRSLQSNRFYSREFFSLVRERLRPGGIVAFAAPGSTAYYSPELRQITAVLTATVAAVFPRVEIIPGESNIFLAFADSGGGLPAAPLLAQRLQQRGVATSLITPEHLAWRLDRSQADWFSGSMTAAHALPNLDFSPRLLTANLAQQLSILNPLLKPLLAGLAGSGAGGMAIFTLLLAPLFLLLCSRRRGGALPLLIASSGMTAMLLELMLILVFQISSGVMFQAIALLIALFMGGVCSGSLVATARPQADRRSLIAGEAGLFLLATALLCLFLTEGVKPLPTPPLAAGVALLLFAAGFFAGLQFPAAVRICRGVAGDGAAGRIYAADLLGGWIGGLAGGVLLPFAGFGPCCAVLAAVKLSGLLMLLFRRETGKI